MEVYNQKSFDSTHEINHKVLSKKALEFPLDSIIWREVNKVIAVKPHRKGNIGGVSDGSSGSTINPAKR